MELDSVFYTSVILGTSLGAGILILERFFVFFLHYKYPYEVFTQNLKSNLLVFDFAKVKALCAKYKSKIVPTLIQKIVQEFELNGTQTLAVNIESHLSFLKYRVERRLSLLPSLFYWILFLGCVASLMEVQRVYSVGKQAHEIIEVFYLYTALTSFIKPLILSTMCVATLWFFYLILEGYKDKLTYTLEQPFIVMEYLLNEDVKVSKEKDSSSVQAAQASAEEKPKAAAPDEEII